MTLHVKYADFQQIKRSRSFDNVVPSVTVLERTALDPLEPPLPVRLGVRLLGIILSSLNIEDTSAKPQLTIAI